MGEVLRGKRAAAGGKFIKGGNGKRGISESEERYFYLRSSEAGLFAQHRLLEARADRLRADRAVDFSAGRRKDIAKQRAVAARASGQEILRRRDRVVKCIARVFFVCVCQIKPRCFKRRAKKKNAVGDGFGPVDGRFGAEDLPVLLLVSPAYRRLRKNARRELSVGFGEFVSRKMSEK